MRSRPPVIFDVEGTLIDCVKETIEAWHEVLAEDGKVFTYEQLHRYSGMDGKRMLHELLPDASDATIERLVKAQGEYYRARYLHAVTPFSDARKLIDELAPGYRIALATSSSRDELAVYLERLQIAGSLTAVTCGDDVKEGKPAPDLLELAKQRLDVEAGECVLSVGDTPYDAQAARSAGVIPFATLGGGFSRQTLLDAGFEDVADNLSDLPRLFHRVSS